MIKINNKELKTCLDFIQLSVGSSAMDSDRSKCVFLKSEKDKLYIFSSTDKISISYNIVHWKNEGTEEIDMGFDCKKFRHLCNTNTKENIILEKREDAEGNSWKVKGRGNYKIQNFKIDTGEEYYKIELSNPIFSVNSEDISDAMERSIFFVGEERQDPHLKHFYFDGNLVAADRKSIHVVKVPVQGANIKMLIPQVFYDICKKLSKEISIYDMDNYYIFNGSISSYRIRVPKISGSDKFPDYSEFIEKCNNNKNIIKFDKDKLKKVLETLTFFTNEEFFNRIEMQVTKNKVHFYVRNDDILDEQIECITSGEDITLNLNSKYLKKISELYDKDKIEIKIGSFKDPVFLEDSKSKIILAPIQVKANQ